MQITDETKPVLSESLPLPTTARECRFDGDRPTPSKLVRHHFTDIADIAAFCPEKKPQGLWHDRGWDEDANWRGATQAQARQYAVSGWPDGAARASKLRTKLDAIIPSAPRIARYDVAGALPSIPRFLSGDPRNMKRLTQAPSRKAPVITLLMSMGMSAMVDQKALLASCAAASAIVDILENASFRCEVIAYATTGNDGLHCDVAIRAKAADEAVNLSRLSYTIGHPAVFRVFAFQCWGLSRASEGLGFGLGRPVWFKAEPERGIYVLPNPQKTNCGPDDVKAFWALVGALRDQGCPGIPSDLKAA